jgi:hypothetical protein
MGLLWMLEGSNEQIRQIHHAVSDAQKLNLTFSQAVKR